MYKLITNSNTSFSVHIRDFALHPMRRIPPGSVKLRSQKLHEVRTVNILNANPSESNAEIDRVSLLGAVEILGGSY